MKKSIFTSLLLSFALVSLGQQTYSYKFNGNFNEGSGNGPALNKICTGQFVFETLPDYNINQNVYQFDNNCGFSFDDANGFLASGTYTIELYFKMSGLSSWKRVINFKNSTSDKGCYVFNGQMNFYNIATSAGAPFLAGEYTHYVITRNGNTKEVTMYGDGNHYISFVDNLDDALYDGNNKLIFFQDDNVVPNESSDGSIAMLKIHNFEMDSLGVKASFNNLSGALTSINSLENNPAFSIYPNPASTVLTINMPAADATSNSSFKVQDIMGKTILKGVVTSGKNTINLYSLSSGVYNLMLQDNKGNLFSKRIIKE
ncbi:MAG TPA: T9SS type A sorting domain-containing protein [Flavipsychrobacter sp.]|nr:T9SS type A sorting domain-containing protein [Flavipsychrobacter sp.]